MEFKNLDWHAAQAAQNIILATGDQKKNEVENLITKTLGVMQENGVYAGMLFLLSRTRDADKKMALKIRKELFKLLTTIGMKPEADSGTDTEQILKFVTDNICNDLDTMLMVKQLWEQTLIYARYGAKARE